jgi:GT2 family glycosyltransferase
MQTIGVVTVTYNSEHVIDGFLASLLPQTYSDFILYVVDNASSDGTAERVISYKDPRIHVIASDKNTGAAEGNNLGIRAALALNCQAVLLVNNDTEFDPSLLASLVAGLNAYSCDMIAPKILFHGDEAIIWSAGGGFYPSRGYASHLYGHGEIDRGQWDMPRLVDNAPTTCLLLRKKVFETIGIMDSRYFAYVEDTDLCYRARRAGLKLMYFPSAIVLHKAHSLTGGLLSDFMMRYTTRNRVYFMLKHLGPLRGLYYVPAYQAYLFLQFLSRKIGVSMFWLREKAFFEGIRLWQRSLSDGI